MKKRICFVTLGLPFDGNTIYEKSLGGSETALTYMAMELAKLGNEVWVFCNCPRPGVYNPGVRYYDYSTFDQFAPLVDWDVMVVSRFYQHFLKKFKSKLNILWNHDVLTNPGDFMGSIWGVEKIFNLSKFHVDQYVSQLPDLSKLMYQTRNGVDLKLIDKSIRSVTVQNKNKLIYGARPERGLLLLLERIFPELLKVKPDLVLYVAGYDLGNFPVDPRIEQLYKYIDDLIRQFGRNVVKLGALKKEDYYKHLASSQLYIYPTDFPEISCISAMEAMACRIPFITTDDFALSETVPFAEYKVSCNPNSEEYQRQFVDKVLKFLSDSPDSVKMYRSLVDKGRKWVETNYRWEDVAKEWDSYFDNLFEVRYKGEAKRIYKTLVYNSDIIPALELARREGFVEEERELEAFLEDLYSRDPDAYDKVDAVAPIFDPDLTLESIVRIRAVIPYISGGSVLDAGCHYGECAIAFLNARQDIERVVAFDFSKSCVEKAIRLAEQKCTRPNKLKVLCSDWRDFDLSAHGLEPFDTVFVGELLEHCVDPSEVIDKAESWVKEGGKVVFTVPAGAWEGGHGKTWDDRWHVWGFDYADLMELFGDKEGLLLQMVASGITSRGDLLGNYIVVYTKRSGKKTGRIDLNRKLLTSIPYYTISACMIVRNEEDNLGRCIKSFVDVVDELIINDTGSTDSSIEIAKRFGAKVIETVWPEDFAEARNVSKAQASGDWIFWIDADEVLTGAHNLRKYLNTSLYNGYVIQQHHLCLDMQTKPDVPVRLFRNLPHYKFVGVIHEHCEDTSKGLWDNPIQPALVLNDVHIVHYGYTTERERRIKCSERNLQLLLKDRRKNPGRKLGLVLLQRDYINLSNWELEVTSGRANERVIRYAREAIKIYRENFVDVGNIYHSLSEPFYQRALEILGRNGVPVTPDGMDIPFEMAIIIGGAVGGMQLQPDAPIKPLRRWFSSLAEVKEFLLSKADEFGAAAHLVE